MDRKETGKRNLWKEIILTACSLLLCIVLGLLLIGNLLMIVRGSLNPDRPPSILGVTPMVVLSGSMSGTQEGHLEVGDLIFSVHAEPEELREGDVISYMSGRSTVTHRITAIEQDEKGDLLFITKGDANETEDTEAVTADQLVGRYLGRIPGAGDFALFLQKPVGMLIFVGGPLCLLLVLDFLGRRRKGKHERQKAEELEKEIARLRSLAGENAKTADGK